MGMNEPPSVAPSTATEGQRNETTTLGNGRRSGRGRLDLSLILKAGADLIEDESIHHLSMRNLASRLGVQAMSLYRYVPSRDVLIDGIVDLVLQDLDANPDVHKEPVDGWEEFARRLSYGFRKVAHDHPQVFPVVATRPAQAPWIRPPMRSLTWIDRFLGALRESGFSAEATVRAYRAYSSFLLGHLLLELAGDDVAISDIIPDASGTEGATDQATLSEEADLSEFPSISELESLLKENHSRQEFERGLEETISWMARLQDA